MGYTNYQSRFDGLIVVLLGALIFLGCIASPPSLMDDIDASHGQISRTMLETGDWVTPRLDGVKYLEKAPFHAWLIAISYSIFGVNDWAARIPLALGAILLCWVTFRFGKWAFPGAAGLYAGMVLATCAGLFLFTRVLMPDAILTLFITLAMWGFLRALEEDEKRPAIWALAAAGSLGVGILIKGLIALVAPCGAMFFYLVITRQLLKRRTWQRLHPFYGLGIVFLIAAPWHILATIQNPPYFDFTLKSGPGRYRGFFWFYFINEHLLRFLNQRYPRDYNTVPRLQFWLMHLVWLAPWSVFFPAVATLKFRPADRGARARLLAVCWTGFLLIFFSFSTTQEYYSMPCYPALALLLGYAMAADGRWIRIGTKIAAAAATAGAVAMAAILFRVWNIAAPGDISVALTQHPEAYTLALGHMSDLTVHAFAYLRTPLALAGLAFLVGAYGAWRYSGRLAFVHMAFMMVLFAHAARLALVVFDPYLSSKPLADALVRSPQGKLIVYDSYYTFSSVMFYANRPALLLDGRVNNLEYGSNAPGAPQVFPDDAEFVRLWQSPERCYLAVEGPNVPKFERLAGRASLHVVKASGGKFLLTNLPLAGAGEVAEAENAHHH